MTLFLSANTSFSKTNRARAALVLQHHCSGRPGVNGTGP